MKYLIVGLGNIGPEYELTRHNAGFLAVDQLADKHALSFTAERYGSKAMFRLKGRQVHILKPATYMNLSGKACHYWLQQLKISPDRMLIVTDDIALPLGTLRMRAKGSNAGHNGLAHIEETLGTIVYPRLRIGIGNDFHRGRQVNYVLDRFSDEEFKALPEIFKRCVEMMESFCTIGIDMTMTRYNK
jgi:PTH1 family peptidyl-tRNA hydrolase